MLTLAAILFIIFCWLVFLLYFLMIVIRPFRLRYLARTYGLHYKWLEIEKATYGILSYEVKKNVMRSKSKDLLIYDVAGPHGLNFVNHSIYKERVTMLIFKKKRQSLRDKWIGYASPADIERFIRNHRSK